MGLDYYETMDHCTFILLQSIPICSWVRNREWSILWQPKREIRSQMEKVQVVVLFQIYSSQETSTKSVIMKNGSSSQTNVSSLKSKSKGSQQEVSGLFYCKILISRMVPWIDRPLPCTPVLPLLLPWRVILNDERIDLPWINRKKRGPPQLNRSRPIRLLERVRTLKSRTFASLHLQTRRRSDQSPFWRRQTSV